MKPKDLISPFKWDERRPCIEESVFYVPNYYLKHSEFSLPSWESPSLFGNNNPICIEYCSGNGDWVIDRAKKFKHLNWIAIEMRFDRVRKIWSKKKNAGLDNILIVSGEGKTFTHHYVPDASIDGVYINFPDPWPKKKHQKHRIIQPLFIKELARVLKQGGEVTFVSDDYDYLQEALSFFLDHPEFQPRYPDPFFVTDFSDYGTSYFDILWREKGKQICYMQFIKKEMR